MTKWEYKTVAVEVHVGIKGVSFFVWRIDRENVKPKTTKFSDYLEKLGEEGWELIAVAQFGATVHHYFKRPKSN